MRFTIGSLATGVTLFVLLVAVWSAFSDRLRQTAVQVRTTSPDGRHMVAAVDPARGTVVIDGPNDLDLTDSDGWDGGLDAASW